MTNERDEGTEEGNGATPDAGDAPSPAEEPSPADFGPPVGAAPVAPAATDHAAPGVSALPAGGVSSAMPPRRDGNRMALWVAIAAALLLAFVAVMSLRGSGGGSGSTADWLTVVADEMPANAGFVLALPGLAQLQEDQLAGRFITDLVEEHVEDLEEIREELGFVEDAPIGVGFVVGDFGSAEEPFIVLISFATSFSRSALASRLRSELEEWEGSAMVEVRGNPWACGPDEDDPGFTTCVGLVGQRLMIVRTPPGLQADGDLLAELTGLDGSPRLSSLGAFRDASRFPPGASATVIVDGDAVGEAMELMEPGSGMFFQSFGFLTAALYSTEDEVVLVMNSAYDADSPDARVMTRTRNASRIDALPTPILAGLHFRYDLEVLVEHQLADLLDNPAFREEMDLDDLDVAVATIEGMLEMSLRDDLLPAFDGELLIALHSLDFMNMGTRPLLTVGFGVADSDTVERFLARLESLSGLIDLPITSTTVDGVTVRMAEFDGEPVQMALHDDVLWMASGRDVLSRALTGALPTVAAEENPDETLRFLSGEEGAFAMAVDISGLITAFPMLAMIGITAPPPLENGDPAILMTLEGQPQQDGFSTSTLRIRGLAPLIDQVSNL